MPITPLPPLDRSSVTFKADVDTFFASGLPLFSVQVNAAAISIAASQVDVDENAVVATNQATSAAGSASTATTQAGNASTSATSAAVQAAASLASANNAESSRLSADKSYLGAKAAAPALDNQGAALANGATYWDTVIGGGSMRVWQTSTWVTIPANSAASVTNTPAGGITATTVQDALNGLDSNKSDKLTASRKLFAKDDSSTVVFTKLTASTAQIKAGTYIDVAGVLVAFAAATAVVMPALTAGTDYAIYACRDGTIRADASFTNPTGYTTANSRLIGGFHYGLTAAGTTVAGGSFATTGNGMIWVQSNVDDIAGINRFSLWDLKWRPRCNPAGMALASNQTWVDIYLCSTDTAAKGTSKYNTNIASGAVLPKIPAAFGGNGTTTYASLDWWVANELARANQKRLLWEHEFVDAAFGVTENQSIDATDSTYPATLRNVGYTSKYGIEQASGHHNIWGLDSNFFSEVASPAGSWKDLNGNSGAAGTGRGQIYAFGTSGLSRVLLGGARAYGANSGSRASCWVNYPWNSNWGVGLRAACDHLILV